MSQTLTFPGQIGLGTWRMGSSATTREREVAAAELVQIDAAFPTPRSRRPLEML